jgi:hypothetical protein
MKLRELLAEMPTNLGKDAPFVFSVDGFYRSTGSLSRECQYLGEADIDGKPFKFWLSNNYTQAFVTTEAEDNPEFKDGNGNPTNLVVVDLNLKSTGDIDTPNPIQVDTVSTNSKYLGAGLASVLYTVIARYGYSVISDYTQYNGGVNLWKKIARLSGPRKYVVKIWSIPAQDWLRDDNSLPVTYNEVNLQQGEVWNSISQSPQTLLVLTSK